MSIGEGSVGGVGFKDGLTLNWVHWMGGWDVCGVVHGCFGGV